MGIYMFVIMVLIQFAMYLQVEQLTSFEMRDTHTETERKWN